MFTNVVRWIVDLNFFIYLFLSIQISLHFMHAICLIIGTRLRQSQFRHRISLSQTRFLVDSISYFCNTTRTTTYTIASTLNLYNKFQRHCRGFVCFVEIDFFVQINFIFLLVILFWQLFYLFLCFCIEKKIRIGQCLANFLSLLSFWKISL